MQHMRRYSKETDSREEQKEDDDDGYDWQNNQHDLHMVGLACMQWLPNRNNSFSLAAAGPRLISFLIKRSWELGTRSI